MGEFEARGVSVVGFGSDLRLDSTSFLCQICLSR